ncbi:Uncharacterised protein [uncultured archaeon]|nr:Uncharacterised protein [uncultured archaeon]
MYLKVIFTKEMGLFNKKVKEEVETEDISGLPELPQLPELPEFEDTDEYSNEKLAQLPSFPDSNIGRKFSQNSIKEAVTGKKEDEEVETDEFAENEMQTMRKPRIKEELKKSPSFSQVSRTKPKEAEPLFIRIDKFEEGSHKFEEVKRKTAEIEKMFANLKNIKENEDKELKSFEEEIRQIKEKIEIIDNNVFSKIE